MHFRDIFRYDDVTIPQVLSDVDIMEGKEPPQPSSGIVKNISNVLIMLFFGDTEGQLKGVRLEFSLPPSSYATMVIRELTHLDTSSAYQATLNPTNNNQPS